MTDDDAERSPDEADRRTPWHRLFGIALMETFEGTPWRVELEQELSLRSQLLDVAIIAQTGGDESSKPAAAQRTEPPAMAPQPVQRAGRVRTTPPDPAPPPLGTPETGAEAPELPDGLEHLCAHNLMTFKSRHEALDAWTLDELIGHYVNYRKIRTDADGNRAPLDSFGLYAVATRFPNALSRRHTLEPTARQGVYDLPWGGHRVRVIILNRIDEHPRNAPWEVFASEQDRIRAGLLHYRARYHHRQHDGHWALLERLYLIHSRENPEMAYTMEDFLRETHELVLANMTPEERLKGLEPEERLKGLEPEERLKGLQPEERLKGLEPEERLKGLEPEERLKGLEPEERLKGLEPEERLKGLQPEERLKGLEPEERLKGLEPEERLKGLEPEERLKGLQPEERLKGLEPEEVLRAIDPAVIEAWLAKQRQDH